MRALRFAVAFVAAVACSAGLRAEAPTLLEAAKAADHAAAIAALERHADVNAPDVDGSTALLYAIHSADADLAKRLIAAGADIRVKSSYGATAMSEAAVLANGAVLEALLGAGADVDGANAEGQTPLMVVARSGNVDAAEVLLKHGANVNARETRKGQTALMWAAAQSYPAMVELLLAHGAEVDARSTVHDWQRRVTAEPRVKDLKPGGFTPLLYAARQGCVDCARALLKAGATIDLPDPDSVTPLLSATLNAHWDMAKLLLEAGANPNKWDFWGRTPLFAAIDFNTLPHGGRPDRLSLDDTTALQVAESLLAKGANPNAQLKLFPPYRSLRMDRGADSIIDIGSTPILRAARAADLAAIKLLLDHGALVDLPQTTGATPLMVAAGMGASATDTRGKFRTELEALAATEALLEGGADVNARDNLGRTALHAAAALGYNDVVKSLVEHGADLTAADNDGVKPIDAALGKLKGRGRGPAPVHNDTADLLTQLASAATAAKQ
jgi:ankyrin repeat protein